jgi:imidazolonepropionase-like amidohydrolase
MVLVAGHVLLPGGTLAGDMAVVVQDGKIQRTLPVAEAQGKDIRRFGADAVICPGLIDLFSGIGAAGQTTETVAVIDPAPSAVDAIDARHDDLRTALHAGVTTAMVAPAPSNLVGGVCVSFRTFADGGKLDVLRDDGPLVLAFGEGVWQSDRAPTSRAGALYELRGVLDKARQGNAHPRINALAAGKLDAVLVCGSRHDFNSVRGALGDLTRHCALVHTADAIDLAADHDALTRPAVVGPYDFSSDRRVLLGAAALAESGVEVAIRGGLPGSAPEALRMTAALAVRHGMDPAAARRAITLVPATVAGVGQRVGSIDAGKEADLVVFSHDPLRLDARVLEVYVKGVRVFAASQNSTPAGARP